MNKDLDAALRSAFTGRRGSAVVVNLSSGDVVGRHRPDLAKSLDVAPGSAVKPFTLSAILKRGAAVAQCRGRLTVGGRRLDCCHPGTGSEFGASDALALSCNCWFAEMTVKLEPAHLAAELRAAGLRAGLARTHEALILQALGVEGVAASPMRMVHAYRRIANEYPAEGEIRRGLRLAVETGTAAAAGARVSGKTGTTKDGAWFAGYNGEIALAVYLETGTGGGDAAWVAGEVFKAWRAARH